MKVGLDTSVVLRLLVGEPADQARLALGYVSDIVSKGGQATVSDLVVTEAYYALQHHYETPKNEALAQLRSLLTTPGIKNLGVAAHVLRTPHLESARPGFVDRIIHEQYAPEANVVVTFEKSARKLKKIFVLES